MKTTADINWDEVDAKYQYIAQDKNGSIWAFTKTPTCMLFSWQSTSDGDEYTRLHPPSPGGLNPWDYPWDESLLERPQALVTPPTVAPVREAPVGHKHAQQMMEYAQDALVSEEPWLKWQYLDINGHWIKLVGHPTWRSDNYRRIIRTVTVEIPEELARKFVGAYVTGQDWKAISDVQDLVQKGIEAL